MPGSMDVIVRASEGGKSHARMRVHFFEFMCQPAPTPGGDTKIPSCMYRTLGVEQRDFMIKERLCLKNY
jgi:hypothetical protein